MIRLEDIIALDTESFFNYIKSIPYGYKDHSGKIHLAEDKDFSVKDYSFSSPEEIVQNNCAWCWELMELIKVYCAWHELPYKSYFLEYISDDLHQTHTQVFLQYQGKWCAAPDNCLGLELGTPCFDELQACVDWFVNLFTDYLKHVLKEKYNANKLLVKEYTCTFCSGITDEEYLSLIRK